jgi:hypothetical protein
MLPNPACTRRGYRRSKSAVDMRLKLVLWQRIFHETRRAGEANRWAAPNIHINIMRHLKWMGIVQLST